MAQRIVVDSEQSDSGYENDATFYAAFHLPDSKDLRISHAGDYEAASEHIAFQVVRKPGNLHNHIRRINLMSEMRDSDGLYAALSDLFITLDNSGLALRKRLLESSKPVLQKDNYQALAACMEGGTGALQKLPFTSASVLNKGIKGKRLIVERIETDEPESIRDPLQLALECVEYSQLEEACAILEQAIEEEPQRVELHEELLDIYKSTRDEEAFMAFFDRLNEVGNPHSEAWEKVAELFSGSES